MPKILCPAGDEFELHPEGRAEGQIYEIESRPAMQTQWGVKDKLQVKIESATAVLSDGSPALISLWWTISSHPRSNMYKQRALLKGGKITNEEAATFDTESLVGQRVGYQVVHNTTGDDRIFANIVNLWPIDKPSAPPPDPNEGKASTLIELIGIAVAKGGYDQAKAQEILATVDGRKLDVNQIAWYLGKFEDYLTQRGLMPRSSGDPRDLPF